MPPAMAGSLDGRDQRLGQPAALQQGVDARRVVAAVLERVARWLGRRRLEVHARAEVAARPGQDAGPDLGIVVDAVPGLDHDREHLGGKRVARLRPVQRQDQGVSALLNEGVGALSRGLAHGCPPSCIDATDLSRNVTRSSLGPVALNIADLAEHAIDAVPDRVALICGDDQLTYAQLEEKANRLAHYLIDQGVKKDDKVGLYCRNRIEIVIAMLGIVKAGAILVNVNFRYVEGELKYLFENSDMVALVHERRYADRVANVLPETPNVKTILVVEDGSDDDYPALRRRRVLLGARAGLARARLRRAQRRRHLPALHRRHHRLPQGRDVAPRGHLPGVVRRHRLRDGRVRQGRVRPGQGRRGEPADDPLPDPADDPRRHAVGHLDVDVLRPNHRAGTGIRRRRGVADDRRTQGEPAVLHRRRDGPPAARRADQVARRQGDEPRPVDRCSCWPAPPRCSRRASRRSCSNCCPTGSSPTRSARRRRASAAPASSPRASRTPAARA